MRSICAKCKLENCKDPENNYPEWCLQNKGDWLAKSLKEYEKDENKKLYKISAYVEATGYKEWPRLKEIAEYALEADFESIGIAFCLGLKNEAEKAVEYFEKRGLEVNSAICCCGSFNKKELGVPTKNRLTDNNFEAGCNPIGQAKLLAECDTDFNIVLGLCVGHDSLFFKYSEAPTTVLAVKDRVLGHNPLAAIYNADSYYSHLYE